MPFINRYELFDAIREFFPTAGVSEARIYPDRVEVFTILKDENGRIRRDGDEIVRSQETYWLTSGPSVATAILATQH